MYTFYKKGTMERQLLTLFIQLSIFAIIQVAMESCSPQPLCLFLKHIAKFFRDFLWPRALNRLFFFLAKLIAQAQEFSELYDVVLSFEKNQLFWRSMVNSQLHFLFSL